MKRIYLLALSTIFTVAGVAYGVEITSVEANQGALVANGENVTVLDADKTGFIFKQGEYSIDNSKGTSLDVSEYGPAGNLSLGHDTSLTLQGATNLALEVNTFTVSEGGTLVTKGGTKDFEAAGLMVNDKFVQNGGTVTAHGGAGLVSVGVNAMSYEQYGGALNAIGGYSPHTIGFQVAYDFIQHAGTIYARAQGPDEPDRWAPGIIAASDMSINDTLIIARGGDGMAIDTGGHEDNVLLFGSNSTLALDLSGSGGLPWIRAKGVQINNGATFEVRNIASLPTGVSSYNFIQSNYGIEGEFAFPEASSLSMSIAKTGWYEDDAVYDDYTLYFSRNGDSSNIANNTPTIGTNAKAVLNAFSSFYGSTAAQDTVTYAALHADIDALEQASTPAETARQADLMVAKYTPADAQSAASNLASSVNGMASRSMNRNVFAPAGGGFNQAAVSASSTDALASYAMSCGTVRSVWLTPLAQWTRTRPVSAGFSKTNETTFGAGLGVGIRQDYNFAAGLSFHYLRSNLNSFTTDVDSDIFGFNLFGRKYIANGAAWHPFVEGGAGYSYVDSKVVRKLVDATSKPDSHTLNANLAFGVDMVFGNTTLTPKLGVDYNFVHTGSYSESGIYGLRTQTDDFNSFRGVVGLGVKTQVTDCLYVTANAAYKHEFADRNAITNNRMASLPDILFVSQGERRSRSSGDFGVGFGWQAKANLLVGLNYDLTIAEKQQSHAVAARLALDF
ncbi:MAG: autotransporter domain-containing protein [Planctomycetaceae bacterium]|nr:autotransporter domain-containing protein [Planctomycetaceae bacterium]